MLLQKAFNCCLSNTIAQSQNPNKPQFPMMFPHYGRRCRHHRRVRHHQQQVRARATTPTTSLGRTCLKHTRHEWLDTQPQPTALKEAACQRRFVCVQLHTLTLIEEHVGVRQVVITWQLLTGVLVVVLVPVAAERVLAVRCVVTARRACLSSQTRVTDSKSSYSQA